MTQPKADHLQGTLDLLTSMSQGRSTVTASSSAFGNCLTSCLRSSKALYPAVCRIEQRGWISSNWGVTETGRRAKFYMLTRAGGK